MNRAVEVLVECIPSPLVFSHPVHPTSSPQRERRRYFCNIFGIYKRFAPLAGAFSSKMLHGHFFRKTAISRAEAKKKGRWV